MAKYLSSCIRLFGECCPSSIIIFASDIFRPSFSIFGLLSGTISRLRNNILSSINFSKMFSISIFGVYIDISENISTWDFSDGCHIQILMYWFFSFIRNLTRRYSDVIFFTVVGGLVAAYAAELYFLHSLKVRTFWYRRFRFVIILPFRSATRFWW